MFWSVVGPGEPVAPGDLRADGAVDQREDRRQGHPRPRLRRGDRVSRCRRRQARAALPGPRGALHAQGRHGPLLRIPLHAALVVLAAHQAQQLAHPAGQAGARRVRRGARRQPDQALQEDQDRQRHRHPRGAALLRAAPGKRLSVPLAPARGRGRLLLVRCARRARHHAPGRRERRGASQAAGGRHAGLCASGATEARFNEIAAGSDSRRLDTGKFASRDSDFKAIRKKLSADKGDPDSHELADLEAFEFPGGYFRDADTDDAAKVRMEELAARAPRELGGHAVARRRRRHELHLQGASDGRVRRRLPDRRLRLRRRRIRATKAWATHEGGVERQGEACCWSCCATTRSTPSGPRPLHDTRQEHARTERAGARQQRLPAHRDPGRHAVPAAAPDAARDHAGPADRRSWSAPRARRSTPTSSAA